MVSSGGKRLIPRWYVATVVGSLTVFTLVLVATTAAFADGPAGASMWGLAASSGLLLMVAVRRGVPRRRRDPRSATTAPGVRAPTLTVWPLVGAWIALLVTASVWGWLAITDFGALESPGFSLVTIAGALASPPDLVRLLTGRLHRWTLSTSAEQLTYRGYRTDLTVPWNDVRGAVIQERGPAGVRIDLRGDRSDPVVPITAFDVPAEQLVEEITRARKAARR